MKATSSCELDVAVETLLAQTDGPALVAIDGRSGVGKTTVARQLAARFGGVAITIDDFWVGGTDADWESRTPAERVAFASDWRRLRREVLEPLLAGRAVAWRAFNWDTGAGLSDHVLRSQPAPLIVLDGLYSARPELADLVSFAVLVSLDEQTRRTRLEAREGASCIDRWLLWESAETYYFEQVVSEQRFDLVVTRLQ